MEQFRIITPSSSLAPYVRNYWLLKTAGDSAMLARTVPMGMMSMIFHRGSRLRSIHDNEIHPRAFLGGQEKTFADLEYAGEVDMISVVFHPAGVRAFFDLPMCQINDIRVTAADIGDKEFAMLESSLTGTEDDRLCIILIERFLLGRLRRLQEYNMKRLDTAIRLINSGQTDVSRLAEAACLSTKQFQRIFAEYVGANPKEFSRTIRFQRALRILEIAPETTPSALAYECGFFDQSHLIKEFKALSGYTPGQYIAVCPPHSDYFC